MPVVVIVQESGSVQDDVIVLVQDIVGGVRLEKSVFSVDLIAGLSALQARELTRRGKKGSLEKKNLGDLS